MLLCAPLALSEEKQEWLETSMATKLRADYRPDEWAEMRRFAPLRPEVIDETAKDESALAAAPGTGLVPVAVVVASSGGLPFPSPSPTSLPGPTPQPSPTSQPSPTLPPTATSTPLPTSTVPASPTAAPTATGTSPPTATPTSLPTATATTSPPTPTPTSPPPPPPPPPPHPSGINLTASPTAIAADGVTTSLIRALVLDQYGHPVPDGTQVTFTTDRGTFGGATTVVVTTTGGIAQVMLTSSSSAGVATVNATSDSASGSIAIQFMPRMQISKTVNRSPAPTGSVLMYTIVIQNNTAGGDAASLHTLTDTIPVGFVYVPGSTASAVFGSDPTIAGQDLIWTSPSPYNLVSGGGITSTFQVTAQTTAGTYFNTAFIDGNNFDPVSTGDTAQVTLQGPTLSSLVPTSGCNDAPVSVNISGVDFAPGITANLGAWTLDVTWVDENTVEATVPQDIAAGVYDLTMTNPGGANDTLYGAYTALNCGPFDTTLDSGYLGTYGAEPGFSAPNGDDDQVQVLFLELPNTPGSVYIRVFDPDCGGSTLDIQNGLAWDTPFIYTVYGGSNAYTHPDAQSAHPVAGVSSGVVLTTAVFTENSGTDGNWYTFGPLNVTDGELVNGQRVFKLSIVAGPEPPFAAGTYLADLNLYNVVLSTSPTVNTAPSGSRIFAFSWTFLIPEAGYDTPPRMFPHIASGVSTFTQHNWDYDNDPSGVGAAGITMTTPVRTITVPDTGVSGNNEERSTNHAVLDTERNTTWTVSCWAEPTWTPGDNLVTFWATDQNGKALAIFSRSTIDPPP